MISARLPHRVLPGMPERESMTAVGHDARLLTARATFSKEGL